jgi:hypothetical protein
VIRVYDDLGNTWTPGNSAFMSNSTLVGDRVILDPGERAEYGLSFYTPDQAQNYAANVFVKVEGFGGITGATWGFTFDAGRILLLPFDAADPALGGTSSTGLT